MSAHLRCSRTTIPVLILAVLLSMSVTILARDIVVTSTADSGTGTLRWALQTAQSGDVITFDPIVFPPNNPATILLKSALPPIRYSSLTIDASAGGVVLSGELLRGGEIHCLEIHSTSNIIRGLKILDFSGCGIFLADRAQENTIGGDPTIGEGPFGQGNMIGRCNTGVGVFGTRATGNIVVGNIIGTDVAGDANFGNIDGIGLGDGTTRNTVGPDNTIARNRESGVLVLGRSASGNTITRNSIYENDWAGIRFEETDHTETKILLDEADLAQGRLTGHACPNCVLEFFSDTGVQGRVFEGWTRTDDKGHFEFATSTTLLGPVLTVTATDSLGTTGEFLEFLHFPESSERLQQETDQPAIALVARGSDELEDNRLGQLASLTSDVHSLSDAEGFVNQHIELGLTWYRLALDWLDWCEVVESPRFSTEAVDPNADAAITMLHDKGVEVMLDLVYWDDRTSIANPPERLYTTTAEIDRYVDYARAIVRHFRERVASYALLNEPNVPDPGQFVDAADYVELVRRVVPAIREEDPEVKIAIGEITPLWGCDGLDYLFALLDSDVLPTVDGIVWHWGGASPELQTEFYYRYPELVREIRGIAEVGGFEGELLAEEITLRTGKTPHPSEYMGYKEIPALKYTARITLMNLGLDVGTGLGFENLEQQPVSVRLTKGLCTVMAGHEAIDMPAEVDIDYEPVAYCSFRYSNGDRMLAIWTDGIAQDEDPGIPATIRFPGLAAETVIGIDVLHGFEQELISEIDGDDTIIRDLLVKDYPILIRLSDVTFGADYDETAGDGFHRLGEPDAGTASDRDGDGVPDNEDFCPDWPGSPETSGC